MLKLNVGLSRKIGELNYGSRGASVHLELEVEAGLVQQPEQLKERIRQLFCLAQASVDEQLGVGSDNGNGHGSNGHGHGSQQRGGRPATQSQVRAIHAIASRRRLDLPAELQSRFGIERPDQLLIGEASELIDAIKPQGHLGNVAAVDGGAGSKDRR